MCQIYNALRPIRLLYKNYEVREKVRKTYTFNIVPRAHSRRAETIGFYVRPAAAVVEAGRKKITAYRI